LAREGAEEIVGREDHLGGAPAHDGLEVRRLLPATRRLAQEIKGAENHVLFADRDRRALRQDALDLLLGAGQESAAIGILLVDEEHASEGDEAPQMRKLALRQPLGGRL